MPGKLKNSKKSSRRVSFSDSARFDYEAPRSSSDARRSFDAPHLTPPYDRTDSDDEIDNLLAEDPLYEEKLSQHRRHKVGKRHSRKKRRVLLFSFIALVLLAVTASFSVVAIKSQSKNASTPTEIDKAAMEEEIKGLTEVPSLIGNIPVTGADIPVAPGSPAAKSESAAGDDVSDAPSGEDDDGVSVPATDIDWDNEAADKAAYEADVAKGGVELSNEPPELSPEAVSQAHEVNTKLDEASAAVADSASKIVQHKDPLESLKNAANDLMAWLDAKWKDMISNSEDTGEVIY